MSDGTALDPPTINPAVTTSPSDVTARKPGWAATASRAAAKELTKTVSRKTALNAGRSESGTVNASIAQRAPLGSEALDAALCGASATMMPARPPSSDFNNSTAETAEPLEDTATASAAVPSAAAIAVSVPASTVMSEATEPSKPVTRCPAANNAADPSLRAIPSSRASKRAVNPARSRSALCSSLRNCSTTFSAEVKRSTACACTSSRSTSVLSSPAT